MKTGREDPLYPQAEAMLREQGVVGALDLQRRFVIGYARASWLMEALAASNIGVFDCDKLRSVIMDVPAGEARA